MVILRCLPLFLLLALPCVHSLKLDSTLLQELEQNPGHTTGSILQDIDLDAQDIFVSSEISHLAAGHTRFLRQAEPVPPSATPAPAPSPAQAPTPLVDEDPLTSPEEQPASAPPPGGLQSAPSQAPNPAPSSTQPSPPPPPSAASRGEEEPGETQDSGQSDMEPSEPKDNAGAGVVVGWVVAVLGLVGASVLW